MMGFGRSRNKKTGSLILFSEAVKYFRERYKKADDMEKIRLKTWKFAVVDKCPRVDYSCQTYESFIKTIETADLIRLVRGLSFDVSDIRGGDREAIVALIVDHIVETQ